jgi:3-dehydroquinate synthase
MATIVPVRLGERSYDVHIAAGDPAGAGAFARQRCKGSLAVVVTDEHVMPHAIDVLDSLIRAGFGAQILVLAPGEEQKSLTGAAYIYDRLVDVGADRQSLIVAVGGGVIGDLAGFVAATFARGLPLLMAPTTLLAMVDSSVGGKTAINHARAKNLIGAFHQPVGVWINLGALGTLPDREYRSGLAEVVKYGVILDPGLFEYLEQHAEPILARDFSVVEYIVAQSCRLKASIVEQDEREVTGRRAILNYGHTFAHAFEAVAGYGAWLHGDAVAAGMICASRLAERRGLIDPAITERQRALLRRFGLPVRPDRWPIAELLAAMRSDKKTQSGRFRFVLPKSLGQVGLFDDVPEEQVIQVLTEQMPGEGS